MFTHNAMDRSMDLSKDRLCDLVRSIVGVSPGRRSKNDLIQVLVDYSSNRDAWGLVRFIL